METGGEDDILVIREAIAARNACRRAFQQEEGASTGKEEE